MIFHLYGLLIGLGIVAASEISNRVAKFKKWPGWVVDHGVVWVVGGGIIGARIYHVIDYWQRYYQFDPIKVLWLWNGGLGIWGAVLGGILVIGLYFKRVVERKTKITFWEFLDVCLLGVPLAQGIGRWGNFFNGELYGGPTTLPWGIRVNNESTRVHPLFLYESTLDLALFWLMLRSMKNKKIKPGLVASMYLIGYGVIRILLEPMRVESEVWRISGLPTAQIVAGVMIVLGLIIWLKKSPQRA